MLGVGEHQAGVGEHPAFMILSSIRSFGDLDMPVHFGDLTGAGAEDSGALPVSTGLL